MKTISLKKTDTGAAPPPPMMMMMMPSTLTDPEEVDAALQLIQLSGDSGDNNICTNKASKPNNIDLGAGAAEEESFGNTVNNNNGGGGGSGNYYNSSSAVDDQVSSTTMNNDDVVADNLDDEAFPPRKRKFRSISDLYLKTKPLFKRRQGKKGRINSSNK